MTDLPEGQLSLTAGDCLRDVPHDHLVVGRHLALADVGVLRVGGGLQVGVGLVLHGLELGFESLLFGLLGSLLLTSRELAAKLRKLTREILSLRPLTLEVLGEFFPLSLLLSYPCCAPFAL